MLVRAANKGWDGIGNINRVQYSCGKTGIFHVLSCNESEYACCLL